MSKTLRITFSGICTLAPGFPRNGEQPPAKVHVIMPASPAADIAVDGPDTRAISRHRFFLYAPKEHVMKSTSARVPDFVVRDAKLSTDCEVYLMNRVHVKASRLSVNPLRYNITPGSIGMSSGQPGAANKADIRWYADMREILPGVDQLSATVDPRVTALNQLATSVAGVFELDSGRILANYPCANAGPQTFNRPGGQGPLQRIFAPEFVNELVYPDSVTQVTLEITSLDGDVEPDVTLTWGSSSVIDVRAGNDAVDEIVEIAKNRCGGPVTGTTTDNDFELHYRLLSNAPAAGRPVPVATGGQTRHNGCLGAMVR